MQFRLRLFLLFPMLSLLCMAAGQDTVLLFHPTAYNLELFQKLSEEDLFPLDAYHVLGVYHTGETYDYSKSEEFIALSGNTHFSLREISAKLDAQSLFMENPASGDFRKLFSCSQGALFMGGPDIPPAVYGEKVHLLTRVSDPFRHYLEISYLFHLLGGEQNKTWSPYLDEKPGYVISGICLGMQTLHVATGGSMVQDIPSELYGIWEAENVLDLPRDQMHRNYMDYLSTDCEGPTSYHFHKIDLKNRGLLGKAMGFSAKTDPLVLSSHHQAIEKLGPDWEVIASSMDGKIIEAIHHIRYSHVLGVQFHPEKPGLFDPSIEHPVACDSTINFKEAIADSESYRFHVAFWKQLGQMLQEVSKEK
jgi:putative glutamine amidotransferase